MQRINPQDPVDNPVTLQLLLDTLQASEPYWSTLPAPLPLFLVEAEKALVEALGVSSHDG